MHPADMIFFWAQADPERPAIIQSDMAITYRDFASAIEAVSRRIEQLKLDRREPVAVSIDHPIRQLAVVFALLRLGIPVAPAGRGALPLLRTHGVMNVISVGEGHVLPGGRNIAFQDSWMRRDGTVPAASPPSRSSQAEATPMTFLTSGTTGVPKKVVVPGTAILDWIKMLPVTGGADSDRTLVVADLTSTMGYNHASLLFYTGKTACFARGAADQLALINLFEVDAIIASPQQVLHLVQVIENGARCHVESLKEVRIGGGFLSGGLVKRIRARLCRTVVALYGATETGLVAFANYDAIAAIANAVGFVIPGMRVEIVDDSHKPVGVGAEGRVRFRSEYYAKVFAATHPERSAEAEQVWWYPGDLGRITENGILCIEGRDDDVINCGGVKLSGLVLDEKACRYPGVKDAGVCVVRSSAGIEEIWLGIVPHSAIDLPTFARHLESAEGFGVPVGRIFVLGSLPRNTLGKLQRHRLKDSLKDVKN